MKNNILNNLIMVLTLLAGTSTTIGQENVKQSINPFPLSDAKKEQVVKDLESKISFYSKKHNSKPLDQWPKADRDSFLIAKAKRINILFAPNYYREYNTSPTIKTVRGTNSNPLYSGALKYKVTFHTDTLKEKIVGNELFYATIWNTGEADGYIVPVYTTGSFFSPPLWEEGIYQDWKARNYSPYVYLTGYEDKRTETLDQWYKRMQKEKQAEKDRQKNRR